MDSLPPDLGLQRRLELNERLLACHQKALGHELPNLLIAVQGLLRLLDLESGEQLGTEAKEMLQRLTAATRKAQTLVTALAEFGRLRRDAGSYGAVPLAEIVAEARVQVKQLFPGRTIGYDLAGLDVLVALPHVPLRTVLVQLFRNAIQAADVEPRLDIRTHERADALELCISDNGKGISHERLARLFEPFAAAGEGLGLGLFFCRQLVEAWGGSLRIQSEVGKGTTVTLAFPATTAVRRTV